MTRMVFCEKLKKQAEGLETAPYPGELGERIFNHISKEAWEDWMNYQTRLINEYRLNMLELEAREFVKQETVYFLFGEEKQEAFTQKE